MVNGIFPRDEEPDFLPDQRVDVPRIKVVNRM